MPTLSPYIENDKHKHIYVCYACMYAFIVRVQIKSYPEHSSQESEAQACPVIHTSRREFLICWFRFRLPLKASASCSICDMSSGRSETIEVYNALCILDIHHSLSTFLHIFE